MKVIRSIADKIIVLKNGNVVEEKSMTKYLITQFQNIRKISFFSIINLKMK